MAEVDIDEALLMLRDAAKEVHVEFQKKFGVYPGGAVSRNDAGGVALVVAAINGDVYGHYAQEVHWFGLGPDEAEQLAQLLLKQAAIARMQKRNEKH